MIDPRPQLKPSNRSTRLIFMAAAAGLLFSTVSYSQTPDYPGESPSPQIRLLLESGAYDLALRRIEELQPEVQDITQWLQWESLRYQLYQKRGEWEKLRERLLTLPPLVPDIKRHELMTHAVQFLLTPGHGESAREILRALIWRSGGDSRQLEHWRRLVIRSYLVDDAIQDARIAMVLYDREYLPADGDWDYLFAQVLLRQGEATLAAQRLSNARSPVAEVLRLLARLRAGVDDPQLVLSKCYQLGEELPGNSPLAAANWAVAAEAAAMAFDLPARVEALEQIFNGPGPPSEFSLFDLKVADLWEAYDALGTQLGNEQNLLAGDPGPWMELAFNVKGEGSALRARAINAAVALRIQEEPERGELHLALYERLAKFGLKALAIRLYESQELFSSMSDVPDAVRHRIVADAIEQRDMTLAARFALHLSAPNTEQTQLQWDLIRSRLALFAGDFEQSESILRSLVLSRDTFEMEEADQIMQPIFDLQSVGRGEVVFELLEYLYERVITRTQQREILLWMGDAKRSESEYELAAEYYLRSAYSDSDPYDLWGQSARYSAAEALADANLFEDARRIYEQLLKEADEGRQAATLKRRLQELWVKKQEGGRIE